MEHIVGFLARSFVLSMMFILPVGVVMYDRSASRIFGPLRYFTLTRKASTMSNSANTVLDL